MDEITKRVALQIPDDMLRYLGRLAESEGFKGRKIGRAIRWCIRREMQRSGALSSRPVAPEPETSTLDLEI